jgi:hypothetical protein
VPLKVNLIAGILLRSNAAMLLQTKHKLLVL